MLWQIEAVGFDWLAAIPGLAAVGILVMAGLQYHHEICQVPGKKEQGAARIGGIAPFPLHRK
jgi:hypothetical protein